MIVSSLFFCITTICFLKEFKLGKNEGYIQRFYDYVGGYGGGLFFLYMFLSGMYGEVSHISVKFVTFLLFIFLGNSRMDFFYKQKYYGLKINSEISLSEINITKRLWYICRIGKYLSLISVVILAFVLLFL